MALTGNEPISAQNLKDVLAPIVSRIEALENNSGGGVPLIM